MATFLQNLDLGEVQVGRNPFVPVARYYSGMDFLLYLAEDVGYRADRVDAYLTVLWHPQEDRLVGVKIKGIRHFFQRLREVAGLESLEERHFKTLVGLLSAGLLEGLGKEIIAEEEASRRETLRRKYALAIQFAEEMASQQKAFIEPRELERMAA